MRIRSETPAWTDVTIEAIALGTGHLELGSKRRGDQNLITVRLVNRSRAVGRSGTLLLSRQHAAQLGLADGSTQYLYIGKWGTEVSVRLQDRSDSALVVAEGYPRLPGLQLSLHKIDAGSLRLGPLLGILIMYRMTRRGPRGSQMSTYVEVMQRAREAGVFAFIFRASAIRGKNGRVKGWTYVNKRWVPCVVPLPDVVYNRISSRPVERRVRRRGLLRWLQHHGIPVFNPHYLNKWSVHRALCNNAQVCQYLPETRRYRNPADISIVLSRYGRAFLKPAGGSLGLGAILVTRQRDGGVRYRMNTMSGRSRTGLLPSVTSIRRVMPRRNDYLVQRGIQLARVGGRSFDVRALVQKDISGDWRLTGAAARIAGRGRITTHVPRGGSRRGLVPVLIEVFGAARTQEIVDRLEDACVKAGAGLEQASGQMFGEFSLDVAIDTEGRVWILEINAKPFRFDEPHLRRTAQRRLVRLSMHLAGCSPAGAQALAD